MLTFKQVSYSYPGADVPALDACSLELAPGTRTVILGANGSGKSTLLLLANGTLAPNKGEVLSDACVALVRQDPQSQLVSARVFEELAFGPANMGLPLEEIRARVESTLELCGLSELAQAETHTLSGGQQQLLSLAGALCVSPSYLLLDEAYSHLDEASRQRMERIINALVSSGVAVLETGHNLRQVFGADKLLVLDAGHIAWEGSPAEFFSSDEPVCGAIRDNDPLAELFLLGVQAGYTAKHCFDVNDFVASLRGKGLCERALQSLHLCTTDNTAVSHTPFSAENVSASYETGKDILHEASLDIKGITLLVGPSAAGKSTFGRVLAGVHKASSGSVELGEKPICPGDVGLVFQRPADQLFAQTVHDDIAFFPKNLGLGGEALEEATMRAATLAGVEDKLAYSPFELSGGETRRAALAGVFSAEPRAYVLDEPTAELSNSACQELCASFTQLANGGCPVLVATHDIDRWLRWATKIAFICEGRVSKAYTVQELSAHPEVFSEAGLEPPLSMRIMLCAKEGTSNA